MNVISKAIYNRKHELVKPETLTCVLTLGVLATEPTLWLVWGRVPSVARPVNHFVGYCCVPRVCSPEIGHRLLLDIYNTLLSHL